MRALAFLLLCLASSLAFAERKPFASADDVSEWMTWYYTHPEPARTGDAILAASRLGILKDGVAAPPLFGFLAGVLAKEPAFAESLAKQLSTLPASDQPVLVLGIWYSGHPDTKKLIADLARSLPSQRVAIRSLTKGTPPRLTDISLEEGPWVLDALWGYFMATGDEAPVVRIMAALPWVEVRGNVPKMMIGGAARWSLTANAIQHPRVLEICKAQLPKQEKKVADALAEVVAQAAKDIESRGRTPVPAPDAR